MDMMNLRRSLIMNSRIPAVLGTASGAVASFNTDLTHKLKSCVCDINAVQSGSGDPSPDNVRPISGWSGVNVALCGKNLYNYEEDYYGQNKIYSSTPGIEGQLVGVTSTAYYGSPKIPVKAGKTYTRNQGSNRWFLFDKNGYFLELVNDESLSITIPEGCCYISWNISSEYANTSIQFELGSEATEYEPYNGQTSTIALPETIYGGTVDVASGVGEKTHGIVDLGTLSWTYSTEFNYFRSLSLDGLIKNSYATREHPLLCSSYKTISDGRSYKDCPDKSIYNASVDGFNYISIIDRDYTNAATFKESLSGVMLVYELATPEPFTVNPASIRTLKGENNVFCDTGNISVAYYKKA